MTDELHGTAGLRQIAFDRRAELLSRLRARGASLVEMAKELGVSQTRVVQLLEQKDRYSQLRVKFPGLSLDVAVKLSRHGFSCREEILRRLQDGTIRFTPFGKQKTTLSNIGTDSLLAICEWVGIDPFDLGHDPLAVGRFAAAIANGANVEEAITAHLVHPGDKHGKDVVRLLLDNLALMSKSDIDRVLQRT